MRIRKGLPMPQPNRKWVALLERMQPGDCVDLARREALLLRVVARRKGRKARQRQLPSGKMRVWVA